MERNIISWNEPLGKPECPYAYRWVLNLGLFAFRIHHWIASDDQRAMHDHPYWMLIVVLKRGYIDVTEKGQERLRRGSIRFRRAKHKHMVRLYSNGQKSKDCWTFLITGPPLRTWGFYVKGKFVKTPKYFQKFGHHQCE